MRHAATWGLQPRTSSVTLNLRLTSSGLASGQLVLRDPFPFVARWPDAGFLTTTDHLANTTNDQGLENHRGIHSAFNIGYMFFRQSALPLVTARGRPAARPPARRTTCLPTCSPQRSKRRAARPLHCGGGRSGAE